MKIKPNKSLGVALEGSGTPSQDPQLCSPCFSLNSSNSYTKKHQSNIKPPMASTGFEAPGTLAHKKY